MEVFIFYLSKYDLHFLFLKMEPSEELILQQGHERGDACRLIREMGEDLEMPTACSSAALVIYHAYRQVH